MSSKEIEQAVQVLEQQFNQGVHDIISFFSQIEFAKLGQLLHDVLTERKTRAEAAKQYADLKLETDNTVKQEASSNFDKLANQSDVVIPASQLNSLKDKKMLEVEKMLGKERQEQKRKYMREPETNILDEISVVPRMRG